MACGCGKPRFRDTRLITTTSHCWEDRFTRAVDRATARREGPIARGRRRAGKRQDAGHHGPAQPPSAARISERRAWSRRHHVHLPRFCPEMSPASDRILV